MRNSQVKYPVNIQIHLLRGVFLAVAVVIACVKPLTPSIFGQYSSEVSDRGDTCYYRKLCSLTVVITTTECLKWGV